MFAEDGPVMTFLAPFITEPIGYDRVLDVTVRNGKKDQGGSVYAASDSIGDKFAKSFAYILDGVKPGVLVSADKIGGALGNFFDRLVFNAVPDFIDLHYNNFHWFTFNVADIFITIGIFIFIFKEFIYKKL